ncbi:MAG: serine hydrolase domain-containing protein [Kordiimonas sp.]
MSHSFVFIRKILMLVAMPVLCCLSVSANEVGVNGKNAKDIEQWVDAYVEKALTEGPAAGLTILVAKGDDVVFSKAYGFADLENKTPSKIGTVYRIGSLTKQFTAVALLQLQEQGKLVLGDDIRKYLPDYPTHGETITIADILHHTSGIKNYIRVGFSDSRIAPGRMVNDAEYRLELRPEEMTSFFRDEPLEFMPGEGWNYSNAGYYLAGLIIEKVSGLSYEEYVETNLFAPSAMAHSSYTNDEELVENRARGYKVVDGKLLNANALSMSVPYSAGALSSTVGDLFKWNRVLHKSNQLLNSASYSQLITPGKLKNGKTVPLNYALGIAAANRDGHVSILHPGGINGFSSMLSYFPENDMTLVVLTNTYNKKSRSFADVVELAVGAYLLDADTAQFDFR